MAVHTAILTNSKKQGGQLKLSAPSQGFIPGSLFVPGIPRLKLSEVKAYRRPVYKNE